MNLDQARFNMIEQQIRPWEVLDKAVLTALMQLKREQLVDQIEGAVDKSTGMEEMRITNVHVYDNEQLSECLNVKR